LHLTHRCHDREFLLRFAQDRDRYRALLRKCAHEYKVGILNYCVTCNHVHLLVYPDDNHPKHSVSRFMQALQGRFAQSYNRRKERHGAFWEDRYHATIVEGGRHLWECLKYIDLNMVRAGRVLHPGEWRWTGYAELLGLRERYRVINQTLLLRLMGGVAARDFTVNYSAAIAETVQARRLDREPRWTETIAVGSRTFVEDVRRRVRFRRNLEMTELEDSSGSWAIREVPPAYG
jgi:putative transposase